jgi:hypothetical protein
LDNAALCDLRSVLILPAFSGYNAGETSVPVLAPTDWITESKFGTCRGDGKTDCTASFRKAMTDLADGAVLGVPSGTFVIKGPISIRKRITIRGAGSGSSQIYVANSMGSTFAFTFWSRILRTTGQVTQLTSITRTAKRGTTTIKVRPSRGGT